MHTLVSIFILLLLVGCADSARQRQAVSERDMTVQPTKQNAIVSTASVDKHEQARLEYEASERRDSIRISKVLEVAINYAEDNKLKKSFQYEFESVPDDSSFLVTTRLNYGHLFARDKKHLMVKRNVSWGAICNVFVLDNDQFKKVCAFEQFGATFVRDTLSDVDGDGYKDYLIHWYPSSGCCRRNAFDVHLYQPVSGSFTTAYHFINPTFYPKEKVIRGIEYGHPGEIGIYKYKWNGRQVDTLEYIYPDAVHKGQFIRIKQQAYKPTKNNGAVLHSLPAEYKHIESIEWFLDY